MPRTRQVAEEIVMKRRWTRLVVLAAVAALPGCGGDGHRPAPPAAALPQPAAAPAAGETGFAWPADFRLVELTHTFDERTIYWPTEAGFQFERGPAGVTE